MNKKNDEKRRPINIAAKPSIKAEIKILAIKQNKSLPDLFEEILIDGLKKYGIDIDDK